MNDFVALAKLIQAIEPWRAHLVLVGGWAHLLYRFHPMANVPNYEPLFTRDADFAFANKAPLEGDVKAALAAAGFNEQLAGEHRPPVAHYTLGDDDAGFYAEFLTPLEGSSVRRNGELDATMSKAGITAQKLRYLELLLIDPWVIRVGPDQGIPLSQPIGVQVANPTSFIAQKFLIQKDRSPAKRAQDLLYIHDALELFGAALPSLKVLWEERVRPALPAKTSRRVVELSFETFSSVTDTIRDAALIPQDRKLSPERMQAACRLALAHILL